MTAKRMAGDLGDDLVHRDVEFHVRVDAVRIHIGIGLREDGGLDLVVLGDVPEVLSTLDYVDLLVTNWGAFHHVGRNLQCHAFPRSASSPPQ